MYILCLNGLWFLRADCRPGDCLLPVWAIYFVTFLLHTPHHTTPHTMQANAGSPYKPSPLSFGSPRASPFRRPSTPNSSQSGTPGSSPSRGYTPMQSPSKLNQSYTAEEGNATSKKTDPIPQPNFSRELPPSPTKGAQGPGRSSPIVGNRSSGLGVPNDAASKLPAHQAREIREAFQVLDRDNDGKVNKDDVVDVLMNLGMDLCARPTELQLTTSRSGLVFSNNLALLPTWSTVNNQLPDLSQHPVTVDGSHVDFPGTPQCAGRL